MKTRVPIAIAVALLLLGALLTSRLQAAPETVVWTQADSASLLHSADWHVVAGGGAPMAATGHQVNGTLGQLSIGPVSAPAHALGSGYWYGIRQEEDEFKIYLPVVIRSG